MSITLALLLGAAAAVAAYFLGSYLEKQRSQHQHALLSTQAQDAAQRLVQEAREDAERQRAQMARDLDVHRQEVRAELEMELDEERRSLRQHRKRNEQRHEQLQQRARRLNDREAMLQQAADALDAVRREAEASQQKAAQLQQAADALHRDVRRRDAEATRRTQEMDALQARLAAEQTRLDALLDEHARRLEQISGLTAREAREQLILQMTDQARLDAAARIKEIRDEAKLRAAREARQIILTTIQRTAASHAIENTVSVVNIQSDEMKGRIIGREGRNIRAFEAVTGIEVIVDDTPEAVILSGFDPVRREIARLSLNRLIQDGRIHPTRIEEVVEKVRTEMEEELVETGERTVIELNLNGLHPDLIRMVGRMKYRTSYGQNLLAHSVETARLASIMASELGLDAARARRAGLLHDVGKVVEEELEHPHAIVGMELCRRYKEHPDVLNAIGAHHDEIEMTTMIAPVVQAADAISGARPGARREALDAYIKRLEKLEALAGAFRGVERVYAIQAGREIRVLVAHDIVSDALAEQLALDISKKIQDEMQYPGQVKVTVIREVRSVAYAK